MERISGSNLIKELVALFNNEPSRFTINTPITINVRSDYKTSDHYVVDVSPTTAPKAACVAEDFRKQVCESFNKKSTNKSWTRKVFVTDKGLNVPQVALDYLSPDRTRYTHLFVRPLEGSDDSFLVNASQGEGTCHRIASYKDGRYIISRSLLERIGIFFWYGDQFTVKQNGSNGNSVIFTKK